MTILAGQSIGAFSFTDQNGKNLKWPDDFSETKLALFFLRHLGCPLCKEKIDELKKGLSRFEDQGVKVAAVVQATDKRAKQYSAKEMVPYILVPDRDKKLYDLFDVKRGGLKEFTSPAVLKSSLRATLKGHMHGKFEGDEFQVPASFLLSPDGAVLFAYYGKNISDFGNIDELLAKA